MTTGCTTTLGLGETVGGETALSTATVLSICRKLNTVINFYNDTALIVYQRNIRCPNTYVRDVSVQTYKTLKRIIQIYTGLQNKCFNIYKYI